jgi:hypothetical protein
MSDPALTYRNPQCESVNANQLKVKRQLSGAFTQINQTATLWVLERVECWNG